MNLVKGDKLAPETRREVLNTFIYRLTSENGYPSRNPCGARIPAISDAQWLSEHAFYVRVDGKLARNRRHAEPCFLAED